MRLTSINLNLLVALDALLEEHSVTRAAHRLGVTQGAMSQSLGQLREIFGDRLLVRGKGGMQPTERAVAIAPELRRTLHAMERLLTDSPAFDPVTDRRTVRVASNDGGQIVLLPALRRALAERAPHVDIDAVQSADGRYSEMLQSGAIDFALDVRIDDASGIRHADLFPSELVIAARSGHPAIGPDAKELSLETLVEVPHVLVGVTTPGVKSPVDRALGAVGKARRVALRVEYFLVAALVCADSDLLWPTDRRVAEIAARHLGLRVYESPLPLEGPMIRLFWHRRFEDDPGHRWLRDRLIEAAHG